MTAGSDLSLGAAAGRRRQRAQQTEAWLSQLPLHPPLWAAYIVLLVYSNNLAEVPPSDVPLPLLVATGSAALGTLVLAVALRDPPRAGVVVTMVVVPLLAFAFIRDAVAAVWTGDDRILVLVLLVLVCLGVVAMERRRASVGSLTLALNVLSALLVGMVLVPIVVGVSVALSRSASVSDTALPARPAVATSPATAPRDIYHLVFDRYGSNEAMRIRFGFDNSGFTRWLEQVGFQVVEDARANYSGSAVSLASTLGMSLLDEVAAQMGPDVGYYGPILDRVRRSPVAAWLQDRGYEYIHLGSWYPPTASSAIADRSFGPGISNDLATTLIDNSALPVVFDPFPSAKQRHAAAAMLQLDRLDVLATESAGAPRYVFAHILVPHPPYVFSEDGSFAPEDATLVSQLMYTNTRIEALVQALLERPEAQRPILILQADEGPVPNDFYAEGGAFDWATASDEDIVGHFGVLNAMYLPGPEGVEELPAGMSLVNTYPEVLERYFGVTVPREPNRSWASLAETPYDLVEVTERLDALDPERDD
jgi:hypothetical protein